MKQSAGLLCYRPPASPADAAKTEVFLVHPGGPFWQNKDLRAWSIPKGEIAPGESALEAAKREFSEETGLDHSSIDWQSSFVELPPLKPSGGKIVHAFAVAADFDPGVIRSNIFTLEWPPRSGQLREFPEVDRAEWFGLDVAAEKLHAGQAALTDLLRALLKTKTI